MIATSVAAFAGFKPELLGFVSALAANNTREWFAANRAAYDELWLAPAREFVIAIGEHLHQLSADIHAEPRIYGSIFAIARDTRFSADKTPYKSHLDLWFWQGDGPSRERPGYFFRLTPESLVLGAGMHSFAADGVLDRYRQAVLDDGRGHALERAAKAIGPHTVQGSTYKRLPSGFTPDHPRAEWLRHSGLYAETEEPIPAELFSNRFPQHCFEHFQRLQPLQQWLVDLLSN
jgi:uncharacterized protein (TIGR02453 family)